MSLHSVFVAGIFVVLIAALISFALKEKPLRTESNMAAALSAQAPVADEGALEAPEATLGREPSVRSAPS